MIEVLDIATPVARKEHRCDYCGGVIRKGEMYERQTDKYDGELYTWKSHIICSRVARNIEIWDEGVGEDEFKAWIDEYVSDYHSDTKSDDIAVEWQNKSYEELAKMIYNEITKEETK